MPESETSIDNKQIVRDVCSILTCRATTYVSVLVPASRLRHVPARRRGPPGLVERRAPLSIMSRDCTTRVYIYSIERRSYTRKIFPPPDPCTQSEVSLRDVRSH